MIWINLNAFHPYCSLDKWIDDARKMGDSPQLKDYYEKNARNLITTWGGSLNDYASRSWAGLISDYYAKALGGVYRYIYQSSWGRCRGGSEAT